MEHSPKNIRIEELIKQIEIPLDNKQQVISYLMSKDFSKNVDMIELSNLNF